MNSGQITQIVVNALMVVTGPTVLGYLFAQLVKRHRGKLTRANEADVMNKRTAVREHRLENYVRDLREDIIEAGLKPRPWPRGLKPKD